MRDDLALVIAGVALAVGGNILLVIGLCLVFRDTVRHRGRWGINLRPVRCPDCGEPAPAIRFPQNWRQTLWGGCTCKVCGTEYNKWGHVVARGDGREAAASVTTDRQL